MNSKQLIITLLVALVLGAIGYATYDKFEKVEESIDIGFTGEARSNALFASRLFLKKMGINAEKIDIYRLEKLPSVNTVIVINTHRLTLSETRIEELMNWVDHGGHVIAITAPAYLDDEEYTDVLQSYLGVTVDSTHYINDSTSDDFDNDSDTDTEEEKDDERYVSELALQGLDKAYKVVVSRVEPILSDVEDEERIEVEGSTFLINRAYGNGLVTLVSDLEFAENKQIENYDHAEFFWQLVHRLHQAPENVWLLNNDDMPALWEWLWQHARQLIIVLSLLLFAWLYALSHRFGPVIPTKTLNRRRILEHIQASGYFFWKRDPQRLLQSCRDSVLQKFGTLFPAWHQLDTDQQLELAEEYSGMPVKKLRYLLFEERKLSMDEFVAAVQDLDKLRKL